MPSLLNKIFYFNSFYCNFIVILMVLGTIQRASSSSYQIHETETIRKKLHLTEHLTDSSQFANKFRQHLSQAANQFIETYQLKFQLTNSSDVFLKSLTPCPKSWPENEYCIIVDFGLPLINVKDSKQRNVRTYTEATTLQNNADYELSYENLEKVWMEFAAVLLSKNGINEYQIPESLPVLALWIFISVLIVAIFVYILYNIWTLDFFKDYRSLNSISTEDILSVNQLESNYDVSKIPSASSQTVPSVSLCSENSKQRAAMGASMDKNEVL